MIGFDGDWCSCIYCMCVCGVVGGADLHSVAQPEQQTSGRGQMDEDQTSFSLFLTPYILSEFILTVIHCWLLYDS